MPHTSPPHLESFKLLCQLLHLLLQSLLIRCHDLLIRPVRLLILCLGLTHLLTLLMHRCWVRCTEAALMSSCGRCSITGHGNTGTNRLLHQLLRLLLRRRLLAVAERLLGQGAHLGNLALQLRLHLPKLCNSCGQEWLAQEERSGGHRRQRIKKDKQTGRRTSTSAASPT